jgi:hypothetical protein
LAAAKHKQQDGKIYEKQKCADATASDDYEYDRCFEYSGTDFETRKACHYTTNPTCPSTTHADETYAISTRASSSGANGSTRPNYSSGANGSARTNYSAGTNGSTGPNYSTSRTRGVWHQSSIVDHQPSIVDHQSSGLVHHQSFTRIPQLKALSNTGTLKYERPGL